MADKSDDLEAQLRGHCCGCGGPCGQTTPVYIEQAADALAAHKAEIARLQSELMAAKLELQIIRKASAISSMTKEQHALFNGEEAGE